MRKIVFIALVGVSAAMCQTPVKEPDTLQALLTEVHALRQDLEGITVASQRVQIALYSLQIQSAAVAHSTERLDAAKSRCSAAESARDRFTSDIQRTEQALAAGTLPPEQARDLESHKTDLKKLADEQTAAVQACQAAQADAASQLQTDQEKLSELQERMDRLDQALEKLGMVQK